jgi:hypothetical protein
VARDVRALRIGSFGYAERIVPLGPPEPASGDDAGNVGGSISGLVRDTNSKPCHDALVILQGTTVTQRTDARGMFGFDPPEGYREKLVRIEVAVGDAREIVEVPSDRIPFCVPVQLPINSTLRSERDPISSVSDLGTIELEPRYPTGLVGMVVYTKPTLGQRLTSPFRRAGRWVGSLFE